MNAYIVSPFRQPTTPILNGPFGEPLRCPTCGNEDQEKFLTVTTLGASLLGWVCAPCEERKRARHT